MITYLLSILHGALWLTIKEDPHTHQLKHSSTRRGWCLFLIVALRVHLFIYHMRNNHRWSANHRSQSVVGQQEAVIFCFRVCGNLCHPEWSLQEQTQFHTTLSLHPKFGMQAILLPPVERLVDWARLLCVDSGKHVVLQAVTSTPRVPPVHNLKCNTKFVKIKKLKVQA
jgi:hypothetical protein